MVKKMNFNERCNAVKKEYSDLVNLPNKAEALGNGILSRYKNPVLTRDHIPLEWRYDFNEKTNPYFMERIGVNAVFNSGAILLDGKILLVARIEGSDRKSYFAVCESDSGTDNFKFWEYPIRLPQTDVLDTNVYDMRLIKHEDGYIYGFFCTERKDENAAAGDTSSAVAKCGIVRTKDLKSWERLKDLKSPSQQRNVVLHPEFVNGKYALYTRPSDGFMDVGRAGGIGFSLVDDIENAVISEELIIESKIYHTIKESKNGAGAPPIKTKEGWLHIAHGVRNTAAGLRYVLYCFMTDLTDPSKVIYTPGGYFMAPLGEERTGDVSNVLFCNGAAVKENGELYIYYASSDTRLHVAAVTLDRMVDYCKNTPQDGYNTHQSVEKICQLIDNNKMIKGWS